MPFVKLNIKFWLAHCIGQWKARRLTSVRILASSMRDWSSWLCRAFQSVQDGTFLSTNEMALFRVANWKPSLAKSQMISRQLFTWPWSSFKFTESFSLIKTGACDNFCFGVWVGLIDLGPFLGLGCGNFPTCIHSCIFGYHVDELKYSTRFNLEFRILTFPKSITGWQEMTLKLPSFWKNPKNMSRDNLSHDRNMIFIKSRYKLSHDSCKVISHFAPWAFGNI